MAKSILNIFGQQIDSYVSITKEEDEQSLGFPANVLAYGLGMRASTDLGSRKRRDEALEFELRDVWLE